MITRLFLTLVVMTLSIPSLAANVGDYVKFSSHGVRWGGLSIYTREIVAFDAKKQKFKVKETRFNLDGTVDDVDFDDVKKKDLEEREASIKFTFDNCGNYNGKLETTLIGQQQVETCVVTVGDPEIKWYAPAVPALIGVGRQLSVTSNGGLFYASLVLEFRKGQ